MQKARMSVNNQGFTLVELMVVVAIIGILAAVAIPNYQKFQAKARQSEAKVGLAAAFTAEKSFSVEHSSFTGCLGDIGIASDSATSRKYYSVGWSAAAPTTGCGPSGTTAPADTCLALGWPTATTSTACATTGTTPNFAPILANAAVTGAVADQTRLPAAVVTGTTFTIGAAGQISTTNGTYDSWTVNQDKAFANTAAGL